MFWLFILEYTAKYFFLPLAFSLFQIRTLESEDDDAMTSNSSPQEIDAKQFTASLCPCNCCAKDHCKKRD